MPLSDPFTLMVVSSRKIWSFAEHNAFPDLISFRSRWYCALRESDQSAFGKNGKIRLLVSADKIQWESLALLEEEHVDLRDPKLSTTPDGRLMLLMGGMRTSSLRNGYQYQSRVAFSTDGSQWSIPEAILEPHEWLWKVVWHQGKAYGVSYRYSNPFSRRRDWRLRLFSSLNGLSYSLISEWEVTGFPSETTLRFFPNGDMAALTRRDRILDDSCWFGVSAPPYKAWNWRSLNHHLAAPNFLILSHEKILISGRFLVKNPYVFSEKVVLAGLESWGIVPFLEFPSKGDCGSPSLLKEEDTIWIAYYSSHEEKTAIYLANVRLPELTAKKFI